MTLDIDGHLEKLWKEQETDEVLAMIGAIGLDGPHARQYLGAGLESFEKGDALGDAAIETCWELGPAASEFVPLLDRIIAGDDADLAWAARRARERIVGAREGGRR